MAKIDKSNDLSVCKASFMYDIIKVIAFNYVYKAELADMWNKEVGVYKAKYEKDEFISDESNKLDILSDIIKGIASTGEFSKDFIKGEYREVALDMEYIHDTLETKVSDIKKIENERTTLSAETKMEHMQTFTNSLNALFTMIEDTEKKVNESKEEGTYKVMIDTDNYPDIDEDFLDAVTSSRVHKK